MLQPQITTGPVVAVLAAALLGCSETDSSASSTSSGTSSAVSTISVDPSDFIGDVPCGALPGAMQSYVATVTDRTYGFTLPSSPPMSCSQRVTFRYILVGHAYTATIDGYEAPASSLMPKGGALSGSRHMELAGSKQPVEPRWTTSCGEDNGQAAVAVKNKRIPIRNCRPLLDHGPPGATAIVVDFAKSVVNLGCTAGGGQVIALNLTPIDSTLAPYIDIPCSVSSLPYLSTPSTPLTTGRLYTFYLEAFDGLEVPDAGPEPADWGALCRATPQEGLTVFANCDELSPDGAITVDAAALFTFNGYPCPQQIQDYQATLTSGPAGFMPGPPTVFVPCEQPMRFDLLAPGDYTVTLKAYIPATTMFAEVFCKASVRPGRDAACSP